MSNQVHVATRKGLFTIVRSANGGGWKIEDVAFLGQPVTMCLADVRDGTWYASLDHGHFGTHLHRSRDQGKHWEEITAPQFPADAVVPQRMPETGEPLGDGPPTKPAALSEIWALEPANNGQSGALWCGTIPGGLFRTFDRGDSWQLVEGLWNREERMQWFGGGKDDPGIHSIAVDPRDPAHVTIAISCGGVWQTRDDDATWECTSNGLRAEYMPPDQAYNPIVQDPHRMVACPSAPEHLWIQHHNGIFRSTDGSTSWQEIKDVEPSVFGFAVAVHPQKPETAWFVPAIKDETRVPKEGRMVVTKTTDGGASFTQLTEGLPGEHAYDIVYRHALEVDATGDRLAMGSSTGGLWLSEDGGDSWITLSTHLPPIYTVRFVDE